jgi:hypothetical protein
MDGIAARRRPRTPDEILDALADDAMAVGDPGLGAAPPDDRGWRTGDLPRRHGRPPGDLMSASSASAANCWSGTS